MRSMKVLVWLIAFVVADSFIAAQERPNPVIGVWKVIERDAPDGKKISNPPPAMRIFTARHYSFIGNPINRPAVPFDKATEAEKAALWNFVAFGGTYEIKGSEAVMQPFVAKDPTLLSPSYSDALTFKMDGPHLLVRTIRPAPGVWSRYQRME